MYSVMRRVSGAWLMLITLITVWGMLPPVQAEEKDQTQTIKGIVQQQDLRRVPQAIIEVKSQDGQMVSSGVSNDAGEFKITVPEDGTYSVSAVQETYRSEYVVLTLGEEPLKPVTLTLSKTKELSLEVVAPLPPINTKASSETYSLSRKEIDLLPRGNNNDLHDVLLTIPGAAYGALKQVHIRQDHANLQLRIDGVPIPETVSTTFSDVITPRAWEGPTLCWAVWKPMWETKRPRSSILRRRAAQSRGSGRSRCSAARIRQSTRHSSMAAQ